MNHRWTNRIFPPLVIVAVVGGVWYAATHRTEDAANTSSTPTTAVASAAPVHSTEPAAEPLATPLVEKLPGKVKFTVDTKKVQKVQKVEFYVSNRLVGAAYSAPYTVSVDEVILQPGTHQVVAKVYTETVTKDTPPADFVSTVPAGTKQNTEAIAVTPPATPNNSNQNPNSNSPSPASPSPSPAPAISAPTNLAGIAGTDATTPSINLSWSAPTDGSAVSYQVWRDGEKIASDITALGYTDFEIEADKPYSYRVVGIGSDGVSFSAPSNTASASYTTPSSNL